MFTGIVEAKAEVIKVGDSGFILSRPAHFQDLQIGASISIAGVCLTITAFDESSLSFDVVPETWERTSLGKIKAGDSVNLERALLAGDRLDGHMVQGHVEGVAEVVSIFSGVDAAISSEAHPTLTIRIPQDLLSLVVSKGSITIDGVSLTVASLQKDLCSIALIPHTLEQTTLGSLKEGDSVNIETDIIGRYVAAQVSPLVAA